MSELHDEPQVDPDLDALLGRALGTGALSRDRRLAHLERLGIAPMRLSSTTVDGMLPFEIGASHSISYSTSDVLPRFSRRWIEIAAVIAAVLVVAGVVFVLTGDDGETEQQIELSPVASVEPFASSTPVQTFAPLPTPTTQQAVAGCDATQWNAGSPRGFEGVVKPDWIEGEGLSLGRTTDRFVEGENEVLWYSLEQRPNTFDPISAWINLEGHRFGPYQRFVPLEQRRVRVDFSERLGYASQQLTRGLRSTIVFPRSGCWEISAEVGSTWLRAVVYVEPDLSWQTSDAIWETLNSRPLWEMGLGDPPNCLRTGTQQPVADFGPLVGDAAGLDMPVYLGGLDETGALHLSGIPQHNGGYYVGVTFVTRHDYDGPILVRTMPDSSPVSYALYTSDAQPSGDLRLFGPSSASETTGWRHWLVYLRLTGPGCYALRVDGLDFSSLLVFEAVLDSPPVGLTPES